MIVRLNNQKIKNDNEMKEKKDKQKKYQKVEEEIELVEKVEKPKVKHDEFSTHD